MVKKIFNELEIVKHHSVSDFMLDEEASIPKGRLFTIGSLIVILSCVLGVHDASAWHSNFGHGSHSNNFYPQHSSHASHTSHSSHSNSLMKW
jgi:hypothetical protein